MSPVLVLMDSPPGQHGMDAFEGQGCAGHIMRDIRIAIVDAFVLVARGDEIPDQVHHRLLSQPRVCQVQGIDEPADGRGC